MKLQRGISTFALLATSICGMIGSGWLFGPFFAAKVAGPAAILSWVIGGVLMIFIALTFAELATTFPVAGGMLRYTQFSHGPLVSFSLGWMAWLSSVVVAPIETLALLQYATNYLPWLMHTVHGVAILTNKGILVAAGVMFLMVLFNLRGVQWVAKSNLALMVFKLIVPIITAFMLLHGHFAMKNFFKFNGFMPNGFHGVLAALPTAGVIFSFIGYSPAIQLAGEAKNPQKALPFAIIGSLIGCIIFYVVIQIAFIGSLNPQDLIHGWSHLHFAGDTGPFAAIAGFLGLAWLVKLIFIDAVISPFGTAFIYTASTARMNIAMCENGFMPKRQMKLNKQGAPMWAIGLNYVIGLLMFLPFPGWQSMVSFLVSAIVMAYAIGPIALVALRKQLPEQSRPFKLPAVSFIGFVAFAICNLIVFWTGWHTVWRLLVAVGLGYVVLLFYKTVKKQELAHTDWKNAWWMFPYFIGLGILSYIGSYGGGLNILPFGWDFIAVVVFSILIYKLALSCALDNADFSPEMIQGVEHA